MNLPHFDLSGSGTPLHFLHANGYPPECYKPLFEHLQPHFRVFGMKLRALWPDTHPNEINDWRPFTDDLLRYLDQAAQEPVFAVGHSIGGIVTLRTALRQPERFRALVLVDPVLFPPYFIVFWKVLRALGLGYRVHPLIAGTLKRRREFDDLEAAFRAYRRRGVFRNFSDESLRAYVNGIVQPREGGGYKLAFSPEWETRIYYTGVANDLDLWRNLKNLRLPTLIVRGAQSDTFWAKTAARVRRANPKVRMEAIGNAGHLVPLERPREVAGLVLEFCKSL